jgi:hypothetical protein
MLVCVSFLFCDESLVQEFRSIRVYLQIRVKQEQCALHPFPESVYSSFSWDSKEIENSPYLAVCE